MTEKVGPHRYHVIEHRDLDLDGDGKVDGKDAARASAVAQRAADELVARRNQGTIIPTSRRDRLERDSERHDLLQQLSGAQPVDLSQVPDEELRGVQQQAGMLNLLLRVREQDQVRQAGQVAGSPATADEIENLDLQPFKQAGIQPLFVTDLDNTAWKGDASVAFVQFMGSRDAVRPEAKPRLDRALLSSLGEAPSEQRVRLLAQQVLTPAQQQQAGQSPSALEAAVRQRIAGNSANENARLASRLFEDKSYKQLGHDAKPWIDGYQMFVAAGALAAGHTPAELDRLGDQLFKQGAPGLPPFAANIYPEQQAKYRALADQGVEGWAISAGLDFLARAGARAVGLDDSRVEAATLPLDAQGRATGAIGRNIFDDKDLVALDLVERRNGLPIACYGDSIVSDTPMAMLVDLVNRTLDPDGDSSQTALAPELKATNPGDLSGTERFLERFNRSHGSAIEFKQQPQTLDEIAALSAQLRTALDQHHTT